MIQFNRYRLVNESPEFHVKFIALTNAIIHEINGDLSRSMDLLKSLSLQYLTNERLPAVAARLLYWNKVSWEDIKYILPNKLPQTFFYKQEIVGCCGFEQSARQWNIDEDKWALYQGFDTQMRPVLSDTGKVVSYQPRSSGFFSVIENIIAAQTIAERDGNEFFVDLTGNWWNYHERFDEIFPQVWHYCNGGLPQMRFDFFREHWLQASDEDALVFGHFKAQAYDDVMKALYQVGNIDGFEEAAVMFVRGGDKLMAETILPPKRMWEDELAWMARRCSSRVILSDDKHLAEQVCSLDPQVINGADQVTGGYHHQPGRKVSCLPIINNYLKMVEAKENMSCPSANIVNAAQWSRCETENYSISNPVHRYLLI